MSAAATQTCLVGVDAGVDGDVGVVADGGGEMWRRSAHGRIASGAWQDDATVPALLAVRPPWAGMLLDGRKTVELRRRGVDLAGRSAVVWETAPVSAAVGVLRLGAAWRTAPDRLWAGMRLADRAGMGRAEYDAWCAGLARVVGIEVLDAARREPVALAELRAAVPGFRAPRSWRRMALDERRALAERWGDA